MKNKQNTTSKSCGISNNLTCHVGIPEEEREKWGFRNICRDNDRKHTKNEKYTKLQIQETYFASKSGVAPFPDKPHAHQ